jgi:hypothetical protein
MSDEKPDTPDEDLAPTKLSSFMRAALADLPVTGDTVKVALPADKASWVQTPLGPFKYAVVGRAALESKDGKWLDSEGKECTLSIGPSEKAAHRP